MSSSGLMATMPPARCLAVRTNRVCNRRARPRRSRWFSTTTPEESSGSTEWVRTDRRVHHGVIGDSMSSASSPTSTRHGSSRTARDDVSRSCCRDSTRVITRSRPGWVEPQAERAGRPRSVPQAGSEEMLRRYIEAVGRGQPDYERMTSEVAAQTHQQLALQPGHRRPARPAAGLVIPGGDEFRQRHLHGSLRQRFGGMANWAGEGRHDRTNCAWSTMTETPVSSVPRASFRDSALVGVAREKPVHALLDRRPGAGRSPAQRTPGSDRPW